MIVCRDCLEAIESHEGKQIKVECYALDNVEIVWGDYNDDGEFVEDAYGSVEAVWCEWCEEYHPIEDSYEI